MQFLYPSFLWALLALTIPIIIHLFHFRRFKKVYFTNVKFLKEVKEETSARSRLRNLLVLLMRLLAMALLILAFAQPFLPQGSEVEKGNKAVSVFIDNSFSMEALSEDVSLLERAKDRARGIINAYREEDEFQILTNDFEGRHQRMVGKEDALNLIDEIAIGPSVRNLNQVLSRQQQALELSSLDNKVAYQLTDFQESISSSLSTWQDTLIEVNLIPLQAVQENNLSIDSVWFDSPIQLLNQSNQLQIKVTNWGTTTAENIRLSINYNGQEKPIGTLSIPAGESVVDTTLVPVLKTGWQTATLTITDFPVTFDDRYFISFEVAEEINMLSINENQPNRYLQAAFGNNDYFKLDNQNASNLNYANFPNYELIILNDLVNLSSGLASELSKYVLNGGNLLIFPAVSANLNSYNAFLNDLPANTLQNLDLLPRAVGSINTDEFVFQDVFEEAEQNLKLPTTQNNFKFSSFSNRKEERLLLYRDGSPYLVKYTIGQGHTYLCAAPLDENTNDLVRNGEIFVPMLLKMAVATGRTKQIAYTIGQDEFVTVKHQAGNADQVYKFNGTTGEFIPEQRVVGANAVLSVNDQVGTAGFYDLIYPSRATAQYAFNFNRQESNLKCFNATDLQAIIANQPKMSLIDATARADFSQLIGERSQGIVLWKWCLILALVFLGLETLLLRVWKV